MSSRAAVVSAVHWHSLQWGDVAAWSAVIVSVVFGVLSYLSSRKSKAERIQAKAEADRAERAVKAAEEASTSAKRTAEALEAQVALATGQVEAEELKPWGLEPVIGSDSTTLQI